MFDLRRQRNDSGRANLPGVQNDGLVGNSRCRYDRSPGVSFCRLRSGEVFGIRFRHGGRANRHVEVWDRRYPAVFSERLEIFATIRLKILPMEWWSVGVLE